MKNQHREELPKKVRTWTICKFKGGLAEKEGMVSLRGDDTPRDTMKIFPEKVNINNFMLNSFIHI